VPFTATGKGGANTSTADGKKHVRSYTLDLTNPENRAAFDRAFATVGPVAIPRVMEPIPWQAAQGTVGDHIDSTATFANRLVRDAVEVEATYTTSEDNQTISAEGGEGLAFGGEGSYRSKSDTLESASVRDNRVPGSQFVPLSSCTK
jgi:hypothetical protein